MANRHLTDFEIQEFLDGHGEQSDSLAGRHLSSCSSCAHRLKQYSKLFSSLKVEPDVRLSSDFAARVVASAVGTPRRRAAMLSVRKLIPVASVFTAIFVAMWYLDSSDVLRAVANVAQTRLTLDWSFLNTLLVRIQDSGGSFMLLLAGALAIVAIWIIDGQVKKTRRNTLTVSI